MNDGQNNDVINNTPFQLRASFSKIKETLFVPNFWLQIQIELFKDNSFPCRHWNGRENGFKNNLPSIS